MTKPKNSEKVVVGGQYVSIQSVSEFQPVFQKIVDNLFSYELDENGDYKWADKAIEIQERLIGIQDQIRSAMMRYEP